jgi:phosphatidylglycerophosphatase A
MNAASTTSPEPVTPAPPGTAAPANGGTAPVRPSARFMLRHPAHLVAMGFGSGLAPRAAGTVGTLWAWVSFLVLDRWLDTTGWALLIALGLLVGQWACTRTAQHLGVADPGAIVWDEIIAFWIVLWLVMPAPWWVQLVAFGFFRYFDAAKPGPVAWADQRFKRRLVAGTPEPIGHRHGFGIVLDDLVAALCTLLLMAVWLWMVRWLWS